MSTGTSLCSPEATGNWRIDPIPKTTDAKEGADLPGFCANSLLKQQFVENSNKVSRNPTEREKRKMKWNGIEKGR